MSDRPWRLAALVPLPVEAVRAFVPGLEVDIVMPAERTPEAAHAVVADVDIVIGDWTGLLRVDPALIAAAPGWRSSSSRARASRCSTCPRSPPPASPPPTAPARTRSASPSGASAPRSPPAAAWSGPTSRSARAAGRSSTSPSTVVSTWPDEGSASSGSAPSGCTRPGCSPRSAARCRTGPAAAADPAETGGAAYAELDDLIARATSSSSSSPSASRPVACSAATDWRRCPGERSSSTPRAAASSTRRRWSSCSTAATSPARALDVFDTEPLPADHPLRTHERVVLSPHVGGATLQSRIRILTAVTDNLRRAMTGEPVHDVQNGVDPLVRRRP